MSFFDPRTRTSGLGGGNGWVASLDMTAQTPGHPVLLPALPPSAYSDPAFAAPIITEPMQTGGPAVLAMQQQNNQAAASVEVLQKLVTKLRGDVAAYAKRVQEVDAHWKKKLAASDAHYKKRITEIDAYWKQRTGAATPAALKTPPAAAAPGARPAPNEAAALSADMQKLNKWLAALYAQADKATPRVKKIGQAESDQTYPAARYPRNAADPLDAIKDRNRRMAHRVSLQVALLKSKGVTPAPQPA